MSVCLSQLGGDFCSDCRIIKVCKDQLVAVSATTDSTPTILFVETGADELSDDPLDTLVVSADPLSQSLDGVMIFWFECVEPNDDPLLGLS